MKRLKTLIPLAVSAALFLLLGMPSCTSDLTPCEADFDCLILCECSGVQGTITVGPYACRAGNCGVQHAEERDCARVCSEAPGYVPPPSDDDDSAGDDDDSASE